MQLLKGPASEHSTPRSIGFYLIVLIVLAVVPLMFIAGVLVARQGTLQREAFERSLLQTSLALSVAVDRQLDTYRVMLETLAQADELRDGNIDGFHALSERVASRHGAIFISLFDSDGRQMFNTLVPARAPLPTPFNDPRVTEGADRPPVGDPTALKQVLATGNAVVSSLLYGLVAQRLLFTVNIPVLRGNRVAHVLTAGFAPEVMSRLLQDNPQFKGVPAVIYDGRGFIVGRWQSADKYVGQRVSSYSFEEVRTRDAGVRTGTTLDGIEVYSYARSPITGWGVNVGTDRSQLTQAITANWLIGGALAALGLIAGVLLALGLASRLRQSIASLADSASRNELPKVKGLRPREIIELERALTDAATARDAEARERESRIAAEARKQEAEEANRMKDRFIAVLSHELRNPLAPIRNSVDLLRVLQERGDRASMQNIVDMLGRQSKQLTRLVDDLLDVSRITSGKIALQRERVDLVAVAEHAIESTRPAIDARHHRLTRELPKGPVEVIGDFARLSQVVSNLLDNAAKYTPSGGEITITVATKADNAVLCVRDNGYGIEASRLPRLFMAFSLDGDQIARTRGGLGLGLSLAKALVELHGGSIEVRSDGDNRGSTFTIRLLRAPAVTEHNPDAASARVAAMPAHTRRVLVVDDNVDAAIALDGLLRSLNQETLVVNDGFAAIQAASDFRPDIVLLDIGMPGMDGYEVAKRLAPIKRERPMRIVATSGWGQDSDKLKSRDAGIDRHLVKPIDLDELIDVLNDAQN